MNIPSYLCKTCFIMYDTWHSIKVDTNEKGNPIYQCKICYETENKEVKTVDNPLSEFKG